MDRNHRSAKGWRYKIGPQQVPGCNAISQSQITMVQKFHIYKTSFIPQIVKCDKSPNARGSSLPVSSVLGSAILQSHNRRFIHKP